MRWRLLLEEYGPQFPYIPREKNIVADALSHLEMIDSPCLKSELQESHFYQDQMSQSQQDLAPEDTIPLEYNLINTHQYKDAQLQILLKSNDSYHKKFLMGVANTYITHMS